MNTATRALLVLGLAGCAGTTATSSREAPPPPPSPASAARGTVALQPVAGVLGIDDEMRFAFQVAPTAGIGVGPCSRPPGRLIELGGELCPGIQGGEDLVGPCVEKETPVQISAAPGPCGQVRQVALTEGGHAIAFATDREGLYWRAEADQPIAPLPGFAARHAGELSGLVGPASLLFFAQDGRFLFLVPLERPPIVVEVATRAEVSPSAEQSAEIRRRALLKARIRLLAKDDRLKEVGLRWALRLGDAGNIEAVARIARRTSDATLRELAEAIMEGYVRSLARAQ